MTKVMAFTSGLDVPSARFRVRQYVPVLKQYDVSLEESYSPFGAYPPKNKFLRPFWGCATLAERIPSIVRSHSYDVVLLQRSFISIYTTFEVFAKAPRILDVDDAIFLRAGVWHSRKLASISERVICGNSYLANWYSQWNKNVRVIPTAVDVSKYTPVVNPAIDDGKVTIGWIGTSNNYRYLYGIEESLAKVLRNNPQAVLKVVSDTPPSFTKINANNYEFERWSEQNEVLSIQGFDIGIMPLIDGDWEKGKCSFKMLQYMACGLPVVVSPVGMNSEVMALGDVGIAASTGNQWVDSLTELILNRRSREAMGANGRRVVVDQFSTQSLAPRLAMELCV